MNDNFVLRELNENDYFNGYFELIFQFTNYKYDINEHAK
jgi:hypothetical protein